MNANFDAGMETVAFHVDEMASGADVKGFHLAATRFLTVADDMRDGDMQERDRFAHLVFTLVHEINAAPPEERGDVAIACLLSLLDGGAE